MVRVIVTLIAVLLVSYFTSKSKKNQEEKEFQSMQMIRDTVKEGKEPPREFSLRYSKAYAAAYVMIAAAFTFFTVFFAVMGQDAFQIAIIFAVITLFFVGFALYFSRWELKVSNSQFTLRQGLFGKPKQYRLEDIKRVQVTPTGVYKVYGEKKRIVSLEPSLDKSLFIYRLHQLGVEGAEFSI